MNKLAKVALRSVVLLSILLMILVGCRQQAEPTTNDNVDIDLSFEPNEPAVGSSTALVTVTDAEGNPINDATVNIRGDMNHAGMQPVLREISAGDNGVYSSQYEWTMAGDWDVTVSVRLPDGTSTEQQFDYSVAGN